MLLLTLVAFALRVSNLGLESLDIDETDGTAFIANGLPDLLARLFRNGENGPLYYLLLYIWAIPAGTTEVALRFPSVLVGSLTVPLSYGVMRRLLGTRAGLLTALLVASSAYLIHYAQMLKMYALVAALAALATYAFLRAGEDGERRWWVAYVFAATALMYSQIFGVLLLLWHGAYVLLRWREFKRTRRGWLAAVGMLTLPYLPLGIWHFDNLRKIGTISRQFTGAATLPGMLAELAGEYGARVEDPPRWAVSFLFASLALLGVVCLTRHTDRRFRTAGLFLGLGVLGPVTLVAVLVALGAPVYSPRYLLITL
ncbi:MAG: glycosyltransferase family 39 protein, partial [Chloroflexi bacterium]|nr:glycosyltransferase family 39 protein [Chloroflexota bacterium]